MLELDIRGSVRKRSKSAYTIHVAEIKSGSGRLEAIEQVVKRLLLTALATSELLRHEIDEEPDISLDGEIFCNRDWVEPTDEEIVGVLSTSFLKTSSRKLHVAIQKF